MDGDQWRKISSFDYIKNHELLMTEISRALKSGGELFDIFTYRDSPYDYEDGWMTTQIFTARLCRPPICCWSTRRDVRRG